MDHELRLSEAEWNLVIELLQRELQDLPVEIHHTRTSRVREDLCQRRTMIRELLGRLQPVATE